MGYKIGEIEGIGAKGAACLAKAGIKTTDDLLEAGRTPAGRKRLVAECGVSAKRLLRWCNCADLMRISGVGEEYSELLEAANCNTVKQMTRRNADNLAKRMLEINTKKKLVRSPPTARDVAKWVTQAKKLKPALSY